MADYTVEKYDYTLNRDNVADIIAETVTDLREQDAKDLTCTGLDIDFGIIGSIMYTEEGYIYRDAEGHILCVIGLCKQFDDAVGRGVWMVGTNRLMQGKYIKSLLIKESKRVVGEWVSKHGLLYNCVNRDNHKSIRWLTWLGAHFLYEQANRENSQLISFYIHRKE